MTWLIFALIACVSTCGAIELTRRSKLDGFEVLLYRCLISGFMLLPFFMYMTWPPHFGFYVMLAASSIVYAWGNIVMSNLATRKNGRVAMMFYPVMIFVTFCLWLAMNPSQLVSLQSQPQQMGLTALCFIVLMASLHFIRRNDYAWKSLLVVAPVGLGFACINIAQKWFIDTPDGGIGMILAIIMISNFGMVAVLPFLSRYRATTSELKITHLPVFPVLPLGAIAVCHMLGGGCLLYAMQLADNPAYPTAVMALTPAVFQVYYWIRGWRDSASPMAGAALTMSAFMLALIHTS